MQNRNLYWLGCWTMGGLHFGPYDQSLATETLSLAYEQGIRCFDSADFYAKGQSDQILAAFLKKKPPHSYKISTKAGLYWSGNTVHYDGSKESLRDGLEKARSLFQKDCIDYFSLHWPDPRIDIRESLDCLSQLKSEKKVSKWGLGNISIDQLSTVNLYDCDFHQIHYNPLHRQTETVLKHCHKMNHHTIVTSPFEQGLLLSPKRSLGKKDHRRKNPHYQRNFETLNADTGPYTKAQLILLWLHSKDFVTTTLLGCRTPKQLHTLLPIIKNPPTLNAVDDIPFWKSLESLYSATNSSDSL